MTAARAVLTDAAPPPAGPYSQAVVAGATIYLAGQTPRTPSGERLVDRPLDVQVRQALDNLAAVAAAAGSSLTATVRTTLYVRPGVDMAVVNDVYAGYFTDPFPARTTVVSDLTTGEIEIDAILWAGDTDGDRVREPGPHSST